MGVGLGAGTAWVDRFASALGGLWPSARTELLLEIARTEWRHSHAWDPHVAAAAYAAVEPDD